MSVDRVAVEDLCAKLREGTGGRHDAAALLEQLLAERDELAQSLEAAEGPHCGSCGAAIDPDCCWCGTEAKHHRGEEHGFVPMGCDCSRHPDDRDWKRCAMDLRSLLWRERKEASELRGQFEGMEAERDHWREAHRLVVTGGEVLLAERDRANEAVADYQKIVAGYGREMAEAREAIGCRGDDDLVPVLKAILRSARRADELLESARGMAEARRLEIEAMRPVVEAAKFVRRGTRGGGYAIVDRMTRDDRGLFDRFNMAVDAYLNRSDK